MQAHKKKQRIVLKVDEKVPNFIESDPIRLQQIVNNLISNAIKFSDEKTQIDIESYYLTEANAFQVTVVDEGSWTNIWSDSDGRSSLTNSWNLTKIWSI